LVRDEIILSRTILFESLSWLRPSSSPSSPALGICPRSHCVLAKAMESERTQIRLAERCALDKTTMVVTGDELERSGLAERRPSPTDRRARIIARSRPATIDARAGRSTARGPKRPFRRAEKPCRSP
jgi:MarR family